MCDAARQLVIDIFNDSAAMEGNEPSFLIALSQFEHEVRNAKRKRVIDAAADAATQMYSQGFKDGAEAQRSATIENMLKAFK